jgi:hypothetical protein
MIAQPNTSQFVERLVKNSNQMRQTGKSDHMSKTYSIASNDFVAKEVKIDDSNPDKMKITRTNNRGKSRFELFKSTVKKKRTLLERFRESPDFVDNEKKVRALLEKSSTHLEQRAEDRLIDFQEHKNEYKENTKTKNSGVDISPLLQGMVKINDLTEKRKGKLSSQEIRRH